MIWQILMTVDTARKAEILEYCEIDGNTAKISAEKYRKIAKNKKPRKPGFSGPKK